MYELTYLLLCLENEFIPTKKYDIKNHFFKGLSSGTAFHRFNTSIIKV